MAKPRFPWLKVRKKSEPEAPLEPPIWMGGYSNGEFFHTPTPAERRIRQLTLERADQISRRLGMERREFLASSMGFMTTLAVINQVGGCGGDNGDGTIGAGPDDVAGGGSGGRGGSGGSGGSAMGPGGGGGSGGTPPGGSGGTGAQPGGGGAGSGGSPAGGGGAGGGMAGDPTVAGDTPYVVPRDATCEPSQLLEGDEFIFDIQTHSFDDGEWRERNTVYANFLTTLGPLSGCSEGLDCFDRDRYGQLMFAESDTTVAVITSWPASICTPDGPNVCGLPLNNAAMRELREWLNDKAQSQRVVNQVQIMPNDRLELQLDVMQMAVDDPDWGAVSWKAYPGWGPGDQGGIGGAGYFLTSDIGRRFIEKGLNLGVPNFAIHKGLPIPGFDIEHNQPIEIGEIANAYPEANFIIYHSGIGAGTDSILGVGMHEGPFDESITDPSAHLGTDQLIASLLQAGVKPNSNVYAEMGSAWVNVMRNPTQAQHYVGKMLKYVGEDNVVWGTDSILFGSPQMQIEAFRRFQITQEFQDRYGYPPLTDAVKRKIFGLNSARIFRVDPERERCKLEANQFARLKRDWDGNFGGRRWTNIAPLGPRTRREFLQLARINLAKGSPG